MRFIGAQSTRYTIRTSRVNVRYCYERVCVEAFGYRLPDEIVTSDEIERRLEPLYRRLRLPPGRLELMSGIRERRFWPRGTLPSQVSTESAERALATSGIDRRHIGALVHGSDWVWRRACRRAQRLPKEALPK